MTKKYVPQTIKEEEEKTYSRAFASCDSATRMGARSARKAPVTSHFLSVGLCVLSALVLSLTLFDCQMFEPAYWRVQND